jgi:hypothetical protein
MFESPSIAQHLGRGVLGLGLLGASAVWAETQPGLMLLTLPLALLALRGCPMCWTLGLVQTIANKISGRKTKGGCVDGRCARP